MTYNYGKKCKKIPQESCNYVNVPKCHSVPQQHCSQVGLNRVELSRWAFEPSFRAELSSRAFEPSIQIDRAWARYNPILSILCQNVTKCPKNIVQKDINRNAMKIFIKYLSKSKNQLVIGQNTGITTMTQAVKKYDVHSLVSCGVKQHFGGYSI